MKRTDKTNKSLRDLILIAGAALIAFVSACHFEAFEWINENTRRTEILQLDEIFVLGFILALAFGVFSLLR